MIKGKNIKKYISFIFKLLCYIVLFFVCLLCGFLVYYIISSQVNANKEDYKPKISLYTIVSPSMTPVIDVYDIVVNIRPDSPNDIEVGDIITYKSKAPNSEGMTITHRVVSIIKNEDGKKEYITQGDNNENPDSIYVDYDSIIGEEKLIIPKIGKLQFLIAEQKGWLFLLLIPVAIIVFKDAYRLIELFGLKRKVDKVAGYVESSALDKKKQEELIRKEKLKKQLENNHIEKDSKTKSALEPKGFLEEYTETVVKVDKNRYKKTKSIKEEVKVEEVKEELKVEEKPVVKKEKPVIIYEQFEILDTDELTSKIKEYDDKISELDKMLQDLENAKLEKEEPKEEFIEENDYLKESKIKVIKVEETKNKKYAPKKKKENFDTTTKIDVIEIKSLLKKDQVEKINITQKNNKNSKKGLIVIEKNRNNK